MNHIKTFSTTKTKDDLCSLSMVNELIPQQKYGPKCKGICKLDIRSPHLPYPVLKQRKKQPTEPLEWLNKFATLHFDKKEKTPYFVDGVREGKVCNMMLHRGQRKLLLSELRFLLTYAKPNDYIVYVGSAPGIHTSFLNTLFSDLNLKWELWDPNPFSKNLVNSKEIFHIQQKYMTHEQIRKWPKDHKSWGKDFLLISDLRSTEGTSNKKEHDKQLLKDNALQKAMVCQWKPRVSMLKFRFPYPDNSENHTISTYLDGKVWFQSFPNQKSTESRLVVERPEEHQQFVEKEYNWTDYEEYLFYHNSIKRRVDFGCDEQFKKLYDGCFDCQSEIRLLQLYVNKYHNGNTSKLLELANQINKHVGNLRYTGIWCSLIKNNILCVNVINKKNNHQKKNNHEKKNKDKKHGDKKHGDKKDVNDGMIDI